jgi:sensor c-di-GMP phosphodiesterase-like protein
LIDVHNSVLAGWNREIYVPIVALAAALGLAVGLLLSRLLIRAQSPVQALGRAIANGEIRPYIQPIFELTTGEIVGGEILARWVKPSGEIIPPARFIPLAEESGLVEALTWRLLDSALARLWFHIRSDPSFVLSFNVSPAHFIKPDFVESIEKHVAEASVSPHQIAIEITERQPFENTDMAAANVRALQGHGFKISIDDVGIGHSGLSNLQSLGANTLKIDKFFVDSVENDSTARSIIEMLVRLAGRLNMSIIAEGIELDAQVKALSTLGVLRGQGFLVSPPVPIQDFLILIDKDEQASRTAVRVA